MNLENLKEILTENYSLNIESNGSNILYIERYELDEYYLDELFNEMKLDFKLIEKTEYEYTYEFKFRENISEISSYDELEAYFSEINEYDKLLKNNSEYIEIYNNSVGMNKISDFTFKFYLNHRDLFSFNLDESEIFSDLFENITSERYEIYENLDEFYNNIGSEYISNFRDYNISVTDESNILIDFSEKTITNLNENNSSEILKTYLRKYFSDASKLNDLLEIYNLFYDFTNIEYYLNTDENLKYMFNKLLINFKSFKHYSNKDEYILIYYNSENENISLNSENIDADEIISQIIETYAYYELDSYEIRNMIKYLTL